MPTEAEWEYAARGGDKTKGFKYAGSNDLIDVGWYDENSGGRTKAVGGLTANELGLYDMSGNVWEWCADRYGKNYYQQCLKEGIAVNPKGPEIADDDFKGCRMFRGGSSVVNDYVCRLAYRLGDVSGNRFIYYGFRLAQD